MKFHLEDESKRRTFKKGWKLAFRHTRCGRGEASEVLAFCKPEVFAKMGTSQCKRCAKHLAKEHA